MRVTLSLLAAALGALLVAPFPLGAQSTAPGTAPATGRAAPPAMAAPPTTAPVTGPNAAQPQAGLVDINSASAQELDKLPGVGPARAQAIIANRPYRAKNELADRKIVPTNVYDGIKDKIVARQGTAGRQGTGSESSGASGAPPRSTTGR